MERRSDCIHDFSMLKQQAGSRSPAVVFLAKESIQSELMESTTVEAAEIGQMPSNHTNQQKCHIRQCGRWKKILLGAEFPDKSGFFPPSLHLNSALNTGRKRGREGAGCFIPESGSSPENGSSVCVCIKDRKEGSELCEGP